MDNHRPIKRPPDYNYLGRWCSTPKCGQLYNVQVGARTGAFISAAVPDKARKLTIVTRCIGCGRNLDDAWLRDSLTAEPLPVVYGRDHDDKDDLNGVVI